MLYGTQGIIYWQYFNTGARPDAAILDKAEELARTILAMEPDSAQGRTLLGLVAVHRADVPAAMRHLEAAVQRDPNDVDATGWLAALCVLTGRDQQARERMERLTALDPVGWLTQAGRPMMAAADGLRHAMSRGCRAAVARTRTCRSTTGSLTA